jgi:hypothetical protein
MPSIEETLREVKRRNPHLKYRSMEPGQVQRFLTKLGYLGPYDRCKYDVIYYQDEGVEKAMVIWGILQREESPED